MNGIPLHAVEAVCSITRLVSFYHAIRQGRQIRRNSRRQRERPLCQVADPSPLNAADDRPPDREYTNDTTVVHAALHEDLLRFSWLSPRLRQYSAGVVHLVVPLSMTFIIRQTD